MEQRRRPNRNPIITTRMIRIRWFHGPLWNVLRFGLWNSVEAGIRAAPPPGDEYETSLACRSTFDWPPCQRRFGARRQETRRWYRGKGQRGFRHGEDRRWQVRRSETRANDDVPIAKRQCLQARKTLRSGRGRPRRDPRHAQGRHARGGRSKILRARSRGDEQAKRLKNDSGKALIYSSTKWHECVFSTSHTRTPPASSSVRAAPGVRWTINSTPQSTQARISVPRVSIATMRPSMTFRALRP